MAERQTQSAAAHTNPLRFQRDGETWVRCPACDAEGVAWRWQRQRAERYREWTGTVYACRGRGCGHTFTLSG